MAPEPKTVSSFKDLIFDEPISKGTEEEEGEIYSQLSEDQCKEKGLYWQRDETHCCDFSKYFCGESPPKPNSKCDAVFCVLPSPKVGSGINKPMEEVKPKGGIFSQLSQDECQRLGLYWQRDESDCCDFSEYFCGESRPKQNSKCDAVRCAAPSFSSSIDKTMVGEKKLISF